jgi:hypothetical protein
VQAAVSLCHSALIRSQGRFFAPIRLRRIYSIIIVRALRGFRAFFSAAPQKNTCVCVIVHKENSSYAKRACALTQMSCFAGVAAAVEMRLGNRALDAECIGLIALVRV